METLFVRLTCPGSPRSTGTASCCASTAGGRGRPWDRGGRSRIPRPGSGANPRPCSGTGPGRRRSRSGLVRGLEVFKQVQCRVGNARTKVQV